MADLDLGSLSYGIKLKKDGTWEEIKEVQNDIKKTGKEAENATKKTESFGNKWSSTNSLFKKLGIVAAITGIGTSIVSMAKKGVTSAMNLESSMNKFRAQTGMTGQEANKVKDTIVNLYGATGRSFDELRQLATNLHNEMGMNAEDIQKYASSFTTYAKVTDQNSADVVTAIAGIKNAWHLSNADIQPLMDKLILSQQKYGLSVTESEQSLRTLAPAFSAVGMNINQAISYLDLFKKAGLSSESATMAFQTALRKVKSPQELQNIINKMQQTKDDSQRAQMGIEYFGKAGTQMAAALKPGSASVSDIEKSLAGATGATQKAAAEMGQNFPAQVKKLQNTLNLFFLKLGQQLVPVVQKLISYIQKNMPEIQKTVINALSIMIPVIQKVAKAAEELINFISQHGTIAKTAIMGIVSAMALMGTAKGFTNVVKTLKDVKGSIKELTSAASKLKSGFSNVSNIASKFGGGLKTIGSAARDGAKSLGKLISGLTESAAEFAKARAKTLASVASLALHKTAILASAAADKVATASQTVLNAVMNANPIVLIITLITALVAALVVLYNKNTTFRNFINSMWSELKSVVGGAINAIKGFFQGLGEKIESVGTWIKNTWNSVCSFFSSLPGRFASFMSGVGSAIVHGFDSAINFIKSLPSKMLGWGKDMIQGLINGIKSMIGAVGDAVSSVGDKIRSFLHHSKPDEGPLADDDQWAPDFVKGLAAGIEKNKHLVTNAVKKLATDVNVGMKLTPAMASIGSYSGSSIVNVPAKTGDLTLHVDHLSVYGYNDLKKLTRDVYNLNQDYLRSKGGH